MWSTIENFRESLSQITADVLDAVEELEPAVSEKSASASDSHGSDGSSQRRSRHLPLLGDPDGLPQQNGNKNGISALREMVNGTLPKIAELQSENRKLQAREKELMKQISDCNLSYKAVKESHEKSLTEIKTIKEMLEKERRELSNAKGQIQRDRKMIEEANKENKQLKADRQKMSLEIAELQRKLSEQVSEVNITRDQARSEAMKELQPTFFMKDEKIQQLHGMVRDLEKENQQLQNEISSLKRRLIHHQQSAATEDNNAGHSIKITTQADVSKQTADILKEAESAFDAERKKYQDRIDTVCAERDKALRDLKRLKQHLIEKEESESEKMEQDSKYIKELEAKADASILKAMRLEQTLTQTLAKQEEVNKKANEQVEEAYKEITALKKKLTSCMNALESKDGELLNLQTALGQYYAEIEAKDRLINELSAARNEINDLSEQLKKSSNVLEMKDKEKQELMERIALQQKKVTDSQEKAHKLEADILRLRSALEQSIIRLNRMSSDSDYYVDRRIVIKLLVTYFQRHQSKEVLDLMARMLGFTDEDKKAIGVAQQGKGVIRGVLGLPGRVVGGIIRSGSSSSMPDLAQSDNQSFADLWVDFLLKESEERERRDALASGISESGQSGQKSASRTDLEKWETSNVSGTISTGSEFSVVPLNASPSTGRSFLH